MIPDSKLEQLEEEALDGTYESEEISEEDADRVESLLGPYSSRLSKGADEAVESAIESFQASKKTRLPTIIEIQGDETEEEESEEVVNEVTHQPKKFTIKIGSRTI